MLDLTPYVGKSGAGLYEQDLANILPNELKRNWSSTQGGAT